MFVIPRQSSVPQGGVWSQDSLDFDISELPDALSNEADDFEYTDDNNVAD